MQTSRKPRSTACYPHRFSSNSVATSTGIFFQQSREDQQAVLYSSHPSEPDRWFYNSDLQLIKFSSQSFRNAIIFNSRSTINNSSKSKRKEIHPTGPSKWVFPVPRPIIQEIIRISRNINVHNRTFFYTFLNFISHLLITFAVFPSSDNVNLPEYIYVYSFHKRPQYGDLWFLTEHNRLEIVYISFFINAINIYGGPFTYPFPSPTEELTSLFILPVEFTTKMQLWR